MSPALALPSVSVQQVDEADQADEHVDGVEAGDQEIGAGPHVAAGNHDRQLRARGAASLRSFEVAVRLPRPRRRFGARRLSRGFGRSIGRRPA